VRWPAWRRTRLISSSDGRNGGTGDTNDLNLLTEDCEEEWGICLSLGGGAPGAGIASASLHTGNVRGKG